MECLVVYWLVMLSVPAASKVCFIIHEQENDGTCHKPKSI